MLNFSVQIIPSKLEKLKDIHQREKDITKGMHEACYSMTLIMTLKAITLGTFQVDVVYNFLIFPQIVFYQMVPYT